MGGKSQLRRLLKLLPDPGAVNEQRIELIHFLLEGEICSAVHHDLDTAEELITARWSELIDAGSNFPRPGDPLEPIEDDGTLEGRLGWLLELNRKLYTEGEEAPLACWKPLRPHAGQREYLLCDARFVVVPAARRAGKGEISKRRLIRKALTTDLPQSFWMCMAPVQTQSNSIFWQDLRRMIPKKFVARTSEVEKSIVLHNGAVIQVIGADRPERSEGVPGGISGCILDEAGNMKRQTFDFHIRPALSTRGREGSCDLTGVPEGKGGWYHDTYQRARNGLDDWSTFSWKSDTVMDPEEVAAARDYLSADVFQQEYEGEWVAHGDRIYWAFDERSHTLVDAPWSKRNDLYLCLDFGSSPGVAVVLQDWVVPEEQRQKDWDAIVTAAIGEIYIPKGSNTHLVCSEFIERWGDHEGNVRVFGDATGNSLRASSIEGSDWSLAEQVLRPHFGYRIRFDVPSANPPERNRVNAFNARLRNASGTVRFIVDRRACPMLVRDLESVVVMEGTSGKIDKSDWALSHLSDSVGYAMHYMFPISGGPGSSVTYG